MYFGEDKQKIQNIVKNQMLHFRELYADQLKLMPLLHWNPNKSTIEVVSFPLNISYIL